MYLQNLHPLFHENDLGGSLLCYIKCYMSKANQAITRKGLQMYSQNLHALFHENDLGASLLCYIKCYLSEANQAMNQKGDCGLLQSESLFAAALNQRDTYFRTLNHKSYVNANPLTGPNEPRFVCDL